ncbi:hypothetical protein D3C71_1670490 [compost metagenome]
MRGIIALFPEKTAFLISRHSLGITRPGIQVQAGPALVNRFLQCAEDEHLADLAAMVIGPDIQQRDI